MPHDAGKAAPHVVLIDDNDVDQMLYKRLIDRSGRFGEVTSFVYADEALDWLSRAERTPVDLVLLDVNMPRMNGFEFLEAACERLGDDFAKAVVIMLTTSLDPRDRRRAGRHATVKGFFVKPLTPALLEEALSIVGGGSANQSPSARGSAALPARS